MARSCKRNPKDRRDAKFVKQPGRQTVMAALWPRRTDCEVFLQDVIDVLNAGSGTMDTSGVSQELEAAISVCQTAYDQINQQMEEVFDSAFYTTYAQHSVAQGKTESFIVGSMKKVILGALAGIVIACGLWLMSALLPELKPRDEKEAAGKEAAER